MNRTSFDEGQRLLQRRAIDDPLLRPVYLERALAFGQPPQEPVTLGWEWEELQVRKRRLRDQYLDYGRRYLTHFLQQTEQQLIITPRDHALSFMDGTKYLWDLYPQEANNILSFLDAVPNLYPSPGKEYLHKLLDGQLTVWESTDAEDAGDDIPPPPWRRIPSPYSQDIT